MVTGIIKNASFGGHRSPLSLQFYYIKGIRRVQPLFSLSAEQVGSIRAHQKRIYKDIQNNKDLQSQPKSSSPNGIKKEYAISELISNKGGR